MNDSRRRPGRVEPQLARAGWGDEGKAFSPRGGASDRWSAKFCAGWVGRTAGAGRAARLSRRGGAFEPAFRVGGREAGSVFAKVVRVLPPATPRACPGEDRGFTHGTTAGSHVAPHGGCCGAGEDGEQRLGRRRWERRLLRECGLAGGKTRTTFHSHLEHDGPGPQQAAHALVFFPGCGAQESEVRHSLGAFGKHSRCGLPPVTPAARLLERLRSDGGLGAPTSCADETKGLVFKWLNRGSRRKSCTLPAFTAARESGKLPPRHHRNPAAEIRSTARPTACMMISTMNQPARVAVRHARHSEEPGAGIPHAGICDGDAGQTAFLP